MLNSAASARFSADTVCRLTLSPHSKTYAGLIVSLFCMEFVYSTHVELTLFWFSLLKTAIRDQRALTLTRALKTEEVDIKNPIAVLKLH